MPLQKQLIPITFSGGVDTKSDSKTVIPSKLLTLENGYWQKANRLQKRNGYDVLNTLVKNSSALIQRGEAIGVFKNELNLYTGTKLFTYGEASQAWFDKGQVLSIRVTGKSVVKNSYSQKNISVDTNSNITCFAWEDSRGGVRYSIIDEVTGSNLVHDLEVSATGVRPKVVSLGTEIFIFYALTATTQIVYKRITVSEPAMIGSEIVVTSDLNAIPNYDAITIGSRIFIAFYDDSNTITLVFIEFPSFTISSVNITAESASGCISLSTDSFQNVWVFYNDGSEVAAFVKSYIFTTVLAPTTIETTADVINNITGSVISDTAQVFYERDAALSYNTLITKNTLSLGGSAGTASTFKRSVGLAAKSFVNNESVYVPTIHSSELQATYFIMAGTGEVVAKINPSNGGNLVDNKTLSGVPLLNSNQYIFANSIKGSLQSEDRTIFSNLGVNSTIINFNSDNKFQNVTNEGLYIVGGVLQFYDGVSVVEDNFNLYPEYVSVSSATSGGALEGGTYQYVVCYEWTDNLGQIHRSTPSLAISITLPTGATLTKTGATITSGSTVITNLNNTTDLFVGQVVTNANIQVGSRIQSIDSASQITLDLPASGTASSQSIETVYTNKPTVVIPTLRITEKTGVRTNVRCVVYRTRNNQANFYRVTSTVAPLFNNPSVDTVSFIDTTSDFSALSNDLLYTTGGVLQNNPAPSCELIATYKTRVVIAGLEDKLLFGYSKAKVQGSPVEFSDFFYQRVDPRGGNITAVGALDDYIVLFKRGSIFVLSGQGPNDTGTQNDFADPVEITTDVGCDNPNSVVITPKGLMFKSTKGIYLLDRSLAVTYIGAEVEDFNDRLITASTLLNDKNQVRFVTDNNICLVYDYYFAQWSTFTNHTAEDCALWNDSFVFLKSTGEVWLENASSFSDNGIPIVLKFATAWLSFTGLQNFQRVYRLMMLGEYKSSHKLLVNIGYNFNPYFEQNVIIEPDLLYDVGNTYGSNSPYGEGTYGGDFPLYQFKVHISKQKCTAIRFQFEDTQNYLGGSYGEGFNMTAMTLEVGNKPTLRKFSARNTFPVNT